MARFVEHPFVGIHQQLKLHRRLDDRQRRHAQTRTAPTGYEILTRQLEQGGDKARLVVARILPNLLQPVAAILEMAAELGAVVEG